MTAPLSIAFLSAEDLGESHQTDLDPSRDVRGLIIGTEDDLGFQRALSVVPNIEFLRYEVYFKLVKNY